jgi:hypothetical protein
MQTKKMLLDESKEKTADLCRNVLLSIARIPPPMSLNEPTATFETAQSVQYADASLASGKKTSEIPMKIDARQVQTPTNGAFKTTQSRLSPSSMVEDQYVTQVGK